MTKASLFLNEKFFIRSLKELLMSFGLDNLLVISREVSLQIKWLELQPQLLQRKLPFNSTQQ